MPLTGDPSAGIAQRFFARLCKWFLADNAEHKESNEFAETVWASVFSGIGIRTCGSFRYSSLSMLSIFRINIYTVCI
jgi:hypothetical protein